MTDLPPFSANPTCPKCGDDCASRHWFAGNDQMPECHILICLGCNHVWTVAPLDATNADDEPEDAYLDAKLAAQTPPDAQKPASTARKAETGISYPGDRYHTVESNLERLTACAQETPSGIGADSEPSIPVSRIVAVLAERHAYHERETRQRTHMTHLGRRWECDAIAETLGIEDDYRAELARRKGTA